MTIFSFSKQFVKDVELRAGEGVRGLEKNPLLTAGNAFQKVVSVLTVHQKDNKES